MSGKKDKATLPRDKTSVHLHLGSNVVERFKANGRGPSDPLRLCRCSPTKVGPLMRGQILVACVTAAFSSIGPAAAGVTRFHDWELVCSQDKTQEDDGSRPGSQAAKGPVAQEQPGSPAESESSCRLQQAQAVSGGSDIVFLFNVVMQKKKHVAIISTPLNVYLPAGLELRVDGGSVRRAVFETCNVTGCHAGFALDGDLLAGLRRGRELTVTLKDSKASQTPVRVSLKGIAAGLKALSDHN